MIKIASIFRSPNGHLATFEWEYAPEDFKELKLTKPVFLRGAFVRIEEGIAMEIDNFQSYERVPCVRCGKEIEKPIFFAGSEWIFYEKKPKENADIDGIMLLDMKHLTLDPVPVIRQELQLNRNESAHCEPTCKEFDEPEKGTKALSRLKDLIQKSE